MPQLKGKYSQYLLNADIQKYKKALSDLGNNMGRRQFKELER
jgi:hypothetical protein